MAKNIKKIFKSLIIFSLVIIGLLTVIFFALKSSPVQTRLTNFVIQEVSKNLHADFSVEKVEFKFFNRLVLHKPLFKDQYMDTLLYSKTTTAYLRKVNLKKNIFHISTIEMDSAHFYLDQKGYEVNLDFIIYAMRGDTLAPEKEAETSSSFKIDNIKLHRSTFKLKSDHGPSKGGIVDFSDLTLNDIEIEVQNMHTNGAGVDFDIVKCAFKEPHGFHAINVKSHLRVHKNHLSFGDVTIRTPNSYIVADSISFHHKDFIDYRRFAYKVQTNFIVKESNVGFKDIAYFYKKADNIPENMMFSGHVYGLINSLKAKNLVLQLGRQTEVLTNFNISGLPIIDETFLYLDIKYLTTLATDLEFLNSFTKSETPFTVPKSLESLGLLSYKGSFTGYFDDFVAYGKVTTEHGDVSTDISLNPEDDKTIAFNGDLKTKNFDFGLLFDVSPHVGKLNMDGNINGVFVKDSGFYAQAKGLINNIEVNKYDYKNIEIDGILSDKKYNGEFNIDDPNIRLKFRGQIDFSQDIPVFAFDANVNNANLYGLNVDKSDTTSLLDFRMQANFIGNNFDNAIGVINLFDTRFSKWNEELFLEKIEINSIPQRDTNFMTLRSDIIDADLKGIYKSSTIIQSLQNLYYSYVPAMINERDDTVKVENPNNFNVKINLKDTEKLTKFYLPVLSFGKNSIINFNYNSNNQLFTLNANIPTLDLLQNQFVDLKLKTLSNDTLFTLLMDSKKLTLASNMDLEGFNSTSIIKNNKLDLRVNWENEDTLKYEGNIFVSADVAKQDTSNNLEYNINILPSQICVSNEVWTINNSNINLKNKYIDISPIEIVHDNQMFSMHGSLSPDPGDSLFVKFDSIQLSNANVLSSDGKMLYAGNINGEANIADIYNNPVFYSNLTIENFRINDISLGDADINCNWDQNVKGIELNAISMKDDFKTVDIYGHYFPDTKDIDVDIEGNQLDVKILSPVLKNIFSDVSGHLTANVQVGGKTNAMDFNGNGILEDVKSTVVYINTDYTYSTPIKLRHNILKFDSSIIYDDKGNYGIVNGDISLQDLENVTFDMQVDIQNAHVLDTRGSDNEYFYGQGYASGVVYVTGDDINTFVTINARTEKGTKIMIPLTTPGETIESNFIQFINESQTKEIIQNEYFVDLTGFNLDFDLEVTDDAEAQLIFDSKIGDVIKAKGEGNLKMEITPRGDFNIFGDYDIADGDYLFTLQNIINKRFKIEPGSKITWNGKSNDATVDIEAAYTLKTPLNKLFNDTTEAYYNKRIPVDCEILLSDNLMNPAVNFGIDLPTADPETMARVDNAINTPEKLNRQFLSLLVINSFVSDLSTSTSQADASQYGGIGTVTTSELLSNQLSNWLSQISDEWDIGVNYRPGDEITRDQVEVALSTQILNDRVTLNGNVAYGNENPETSDIVGDFDLEFKLTNKLRVKAFNEANDKKIYEESEYTQGVGVAYREEFDTFGELFARYWRKLFKNKKSETDTLKVGK